MRTITTRVRTHLKAGNVIAVLALFVALSAGATAAVSINGKQIKKGTVSVKKLNKQAKQTLKTQAFVDNVPGVITDQETRVMEVKVPRGKYTAQVNLELHATGAKGTGYCKFRALGGEPTLLGYTGTLSLGDVPGTNIDARFVSMGGGFVAPKGGVVEMTCKHSGGVSALETLEGDLVATRVGGLKAD